MEVLQLVLKYINMVPAEAWNLIGETIFSAIVVSPAMVAVKRWFSIDGKAKMSLLVILASMLASAGWYLKDVPQFAPWFIALQGAAIFTASQPVYYLFVKPLLNRVGKAIHEAAELQAAQERTKVENQAAATPISDIQPVRPAPPVVDDFSH